METETQVKYVTVTIPSMHTTDSVDNFFSGMLIQMNTGSSNFVIDMKDCKTCIPKFIDSLNKIKKQLWGHEGKMVLINVSEAMLALFKSAQIHHHLVFRDTIKEAVAHFNDRTSL